MEFSTLLQFALLIVVVGWLAASFRIAGEDERFIVTTLGRFRRLHGPGLGMTIAFADRWTRIRIGDRGVYRGDGIADFGGVAAPVQVDDATSDDAIRITSFRDGIIATTDTTKVVACERCGHKNLVST